jgi:hypothetical protein
VGTGKTIGTRTEGDGNVESVCMGDSVHHPGTDVSAFLICTRLGLRGRRGKACLGSGSVFRKCSVSAVVGAQRIVQCNSWAEIAV